MIRRVQIHEQELELPLRSLQRVGEPLGHEVRAAACAELALKLRDEVSCLGGGRRQLEQAVPAGLPREAEEGEGAGQHAPGDPGA